MTDHSLLQRRGLSNKEGSKLRNSNSSPMRSAPRAAMACVTLLVGLLQPVRPASTIAADDNPGSRTGRETNQPAEAPPVKEDVEATTAQSRPTDRRREKLRYARRNFDEWREQLLNDLDPKTCIEAMAPIAAFGKRGYAAEAIAALAEVLRSDRIQESEAAVDALAKIGPAALPMLVDGLADKRRAIRYACTQAIMSLGAEGKPAAPNLVKLLSDQELQVRAGAVHSLLAVAGDDMALWPTFERLADSNDPEIRYALAVGLSFHRPQDRWWLEPLLRLADDSSNGIRAAVGGMLAEHGPPEQAVIDAVERLICDDQQNVSNATIAKLAQQGDPRLIAAVFNDAFESPEWWQLFRQRGQLEPMIRRLASVRERAEIAAPLLGKIIEDKKPGWLQNETLAAIDALGSLGPAAKIAYPTLKRIIQNPDLRDDDPLKKHARRTLDKILATDGPEADEQ